MAFSLTEYAKGNVLAVQEYSVLSWRAFANLFSQPRYIGDIVQQMDIIGVGSLPIVVLTGFFTGAVLALQTANSLARFGALSFTGQLVSHLHGARAGAGADRPDGGRAQRQRHGQRTGLDEGDRADRRHARPGHRSHPQSW